MPTKKRQPRKLAKITAERLEELRMESNLTVAEFAERCKLPGKPSPAHTTFVAWRQQQYMALPAAEPASYC